jgi:hypothetical protein
MTNRVTASLYSYLYMTYRPTMYMCHRHRWHTKMYQHTIEVVHNVHLVSSWGVPSVPMAHKNVPAYHRGGAQCPSGLHRRGAIVTDGKPRNVYKLLDGCTSCWMGVRVAGSGDKYHLPVPTHVRPPRTLTRGCSIPPGGRILKYDGRRYAS